ncbi:MAG: molecular chaperone DnaJ [Patescibacteria group bacterium]|jgi:molecular chaperone DnaJ
MSKDYYKILGVEKNASTDEIKKAFKKAAMQHHPDRPGGNEAKFKEINEAYQVLGDAEKRKKYEQFGSDFEQQGGFGGASWEDVMGAFRNGGGSANFGGADFGDIFGDMFGFGGGGRRGGPRQARGHDIQVDVELDFKEAAFGIEKELNLRRQSTCEVCKGSGAEPGSKLETCTSCNGQGQILQNQRTILGTVQTVANCPTCNGRGKHAAKKCKHCGGDGILSKNNQVKVKIPAGIDNGQSIRLTGHGEAAPHNGTSGDLYVRIRIKPSKIFTRDGFDVYTDQEISYSKAVIGATVKVETIDGQLEIKIPEGTESGQLIRLKGHGVQEVGGRGRGDHYVRVKIIVPKKISKNYRKLLDELDKQ